MRGVGYMDRYLLFAVKVATFSTRLNTCSISCSLEDRPPSCGNVTLQPSATTTPSYHMFFSGWLVFLEDITSVMARINLTM